VTVAVPPLPVAGAVSTASTPPPKVGAVDGLTAPIVEASVTGTPSATRAPPAVRTTAVTKAEPWQPTEVGATETVIAEGIPGVVVMVGITVDVATVPVTVGVKVLVAPVGFTVTVPGTLFVPWVALYA
jgi:hypothetical protein